MTSILRPLAAILIALGATIPAALGQEANFKPQKARIVPGEVIVKYRNSGFGKVLPQSSVDRLRDKFGVRPTATIASFGIQRLQLSPGQSVDLAMDALRKDPLVEFVVPNYIVYPYEVTPNDPRWRDMWGLQKIGMPRAWDRTKGGSDVIVAVIDTGVDYEHPDLVNNMWRNARGQVGASFCTDFSDPNNPRALPPVFNPMDRHGHGTHVAGTIAAEGNNGKGMVGVAWHLRIMALRFLCGDDGSGTTGDAIRAIEFAVTNGAHVLNNSWGGGPNELALETAIREADARGILFVAAAGNSGQDLAIEPSYPASYQVDNVVAVSASRPDDTLASFSNWGPRLVHIAAPGVDVLSTSPGNGLRVLSGTSMAAPHVAGCAALLRGLDGARRAKELKALLLDTAQRVGGLTSKVAEGRRLDCGAAVAR